MTTSNYKYASMKKQILSLALLAIFAASCKKETTITTDQTTGDSLVIEQDNMEIDTTNAISDGHTSENSLDWVGNYKGTIPCVSCDGIEATLNLKADGTYTASSMFTERDKKPVDIKGKFTWIESGSKIELDQAGDHRKFQVVENAIIPLDRDGNKFPPLENSGIPDNGSYLLKKVN